MSHRAVPVPRTLIDRVLAVIPSTRPAADDRLLFRLIAQGGVLPNTVVNLTVDAVEIRGNQAHIQTVAGHRPWTLVITDRALVHDLAAHIQTHCIGRYLFLDPATKPLRRPDTLSLEPPKAPDERPMVYRTLLRRWRTYTIQAEVSLSIEDLVRFYTESCQRRRCPQEDVTALRQQIDALRAGRAA